MTNNVIKMDVSQADVLSELPMIPPTNSTILLTKAAFEHLTHIAHIYAKSELVPKRYRNNVSNCVIALELSSRIGVSPLMVMQNLDLMYGKPTWTTKFLIASLNASGKFSPLIYEEDNESEGRCRATAINNINGIKVNGAWASITMAKQEGWYDKKESKWKSMPELMLRYRASSFFINQFAPKVSMGLQTSEEVIDIQEEKKERIDPAHERMMAMIGDATTLEDLNKLEEHVEPELMYYFNEKKELLTNKTQKHV